MDDAVIATDAAGRVIYTNPAARALYGFGGPMQGRLLSEVLRVEGLPHNFDDPQLAKASPWRGPCTEVSANGERLIVDWTIKWVEQDDMDPFCLSIARPSIEPQARERTGLERKLLRVFIDALPEPALFVHEQGTIFVANEALGRVFGAPVAELEGKNPLSRFPKRLAAARAWHFKEAMCTRRPVRFEDKRAGRQFLTTIVPVFESAWQLEGAAIFALDVTALKERARRRAFEQELQQQRLEAMRRLAGEVTHGFNNLLTTILGNTDVSLSQLKESDSAYANLREIRKASREAADLTKRLTDALASCGD